MTQRKQWSKGGPLQLANAPRIICPPNEHIANVIVVDTSIEPADMVLRPNGHHYVNLRSRKPQINTTNTTNAANRPTKYKIKHRRRSIPDVMHKLDKVLEVIDSLPPSEPTLCDWIESLLSNLETSSNFSDQFLQSYPLPKQSPESSLVASLFYFLLQRSHDNLMLRGLLVLFDVQPLLISEYIRHNNSTIIHYTDYVIETIRNCCGHATHAGTLLILLLSSSPDVVVSCDLSLLWSSVVHADDDSVDDIAGMCATLMIALWRQYPDMSLGEWMQLNIPSDAVLHQRDVLTQVLCECVLNELDGLSDLIIDGLQCDTVSPFLEFPLLAIESLAPNSSTEIVNNFSGTVI